MSTEILFHQGTTLVRRHRLAPGEAMAWHRDPCNRVTVVLSGDALEIEFRDSDDKHRVIVTPGQVDWDKPSDRVHRAVNVGNQPYEEVTVFLLDDPNAPHQPTAD